MECRCGQHKTIMALTSSVPGVKKDILYGGKGPPPNYVKNSKVGLIGLA